MPVRRALSVRDVVSRPDVGGFARAHGVFLVVLMTGLVLRVLTVLGYPCPTWFGDSATYLGSAVDLTPSLLRPCGYSVLLWLLKPAHSLTLVVIVQHAMGLAVGVMVYALVWRVARAAGVHRRRRTGPLAGLVAVPVLLDAYLIQLEHLLMADEFFIFLTVAAVSVALWGPRPRWWTGAAAGLLMGFGAVTRSVGLPLLVVLVACLLVRRAGWRPVTAAAVAFAVPLLAYGFWYQSAHGKFALTNTDQVVLYGRTVAFAECAKMKPPPDVAVLCLENLQRDPRIAAPAYQAIWTRSSGFHQIPGKLGSDEANRRAGEFARLAIRTQPGDYAQVVLRDTFRAFGWDREPYPTPWTVREYTFPAEPKAINGYLAEVAYEYGGSTAAPQVKEPYAGWIRGYQNWAYVRGTLLGVILLAGLAGLVLQWRRWGGPALLPWLTSVALLVIPAATADFDYRYVLPALIFATVAAGLAFLRPPKQGADQPPVDAELSSVL
ncbi:hypothetical protein ACRYCC_02330 [Actinomadura scrupuli]|uniref:hypothetical protein n=1 Tax=Actinomadura scrupuli TaxID=559629 RepID=UPI003D9837B8